MRLVILNQYAPPDPSPTARLVGELATELRSKGHEVLVVGSSQNYRQRAEGVFARILREMRALGEIFLGGLRSKSPDVILTASSPPGILIVGTIVSILKRAKSVHWAMDLYPELAFAVGKRLPPPLEAFLLDITRLAYQHASGVVTLDEDMRAHVLSKYSKDSRIIRPWLNNVSFPRIVGYPTTDPFTWLYSGNLGKAHEWKTLLDAQQLLEQRGVSARLAFQGGGAERSAAQRYAESLGLTQVAWLPYAPEGEIVGSLLAAHVMIVTQKPATQGLLWPSKLGLVMALPRPIVFVGPKEGAIARDLIETNRAGIFGPGEHDGLAREIERLYRSWPPEIKPEIAPPFTAEQAGLLWDKILMTL
jgi:colanic acid biosynthesis glycosyl transferase WcaI